MLGLLCGKYDPIRTPNFKGSFQAFEAARQPGDDLVREHERRP